MPHVQCRMSTLGYTVDYRNSDRFREMIMSEHDKYGKIIREASIQGD